MHASFGPGLARLMRASRHRYLRVSCARPVPVHTNLNCSSRQLRFSLQPPEEAVKGALHSVRCTFAN